MKKSILIIVSIILTASTIFAQDIIYTVSGDYNGDKTPLNSIIIDNITNGTSITFADLPDNDYYQINLSKNAYWGTVNVFDIKEASLFSAIQNEPGVFSVIYRGKTAVNSKVEIIDMSGRILYVDNNLFLNPNNSLQIQIGATGVYLIRIDSPNETSTFKAIGANRNEKYSVNIISNVNTKTQESTFLKSVSVIGEGDFTFEEGDSLRIWALKNDMFSLPANKSISKSEEIDFQFENVVYIDNMESFADSVGEEIKFAIDGDTLICIKVDGEYIYQEDIILTEDQIYDDYLKGGSISNSSRLWPNGVVPYYIDESLESNLDEINKAINYWNLNAPVHFIEIVEQTYIGNHVKFVRTSPEKPSRAYQGKILLPIAQPIYLHDDDLYGTIVHEMGHTVGLIHEQSRVDRDNYIDVNLDNVKRSKRKNYTKNPSSLVVEEYDTLSLMGYPSKGYNMSIDPDIPILTIKETGATWKQQRSYLSRNDIKMLEELYGTNAAKRPQIDFVKNENGKYFNYSKDNFSVEIKGKIIDSGESAILEKGVGLIKEGEKYIDYYLTEEGTDNFSVSINNLEPCTNYYFFVYAKNSYGMRTSEYREFYASDFFIETIGIDSTTLGSNSVTLKGKARNYCENQAFAGFVFCDNLGENCQYIGIMDIIDTENYQKEINDLKPDSTYYFKAFINVKSKDYYGELKSFTTNKEQGGEGDGPRDTQTAVVPVTNPATGKTWMDRNLGASRAANSSTDAEAYGDLYQWGRAADGHEKRTSGTTSTLSDSDTPGHGDFITAGSGSNYDWRSPQNDNLWQGVNGTNNPCPEGYRLPTEAELDAERQSWSSNNAAGAFASPLKLPVAGYRYYTGSLNDVGSYGSCWSSTVDGTSSRRLRFGSSNARMYSNYRGRGYSVRCLKD